MPTFIGRDGRRLGREVLAHDSAMAGGSVGVSIAPVLDTAAAYWGYVTAHQGIATLRAAEERAQVLLAEEVDGGVHVVEEGGEMAHAGRVDRPHAVAA